MELRGARFVLRRRFHGRDNLRAASGYAVALFRFESPGSRMNASQAHELQGTSLVIRPNRSLPVAGIALLFTAISVWALTIGVGFALAGMFMILPFAGLEVAVVGLLCRWFYRHVDDCELVTIDADRVHVMKRRGKAVTRYDFPRHWLRIRWDREAPGGTLRVGSHGRFITLGDEINDGDRALLAQELQRLLRSPA